MKRCIFVWKRQEVIAHIENDRAFVLAAIAGLVNSGLAVLEVISDNQAELRLPSGEVFVLGETGIERTW